MALTEKLTAIADAIRDKTGGTDKLTLDSMVTEIGNISGSGGSGGSSAVSAKAVNFYDYDGTRLYAYTVEEAQALTELPALPEHEGLICQGWNFDLDTIKAYNGAVNIGATYITDDGTTRIYIHLEEGRTSPTLGVCPNGTVTVNWGDGTDPDTLTGTSTSTGQWTPTHEYAEPGDYVIRLTVDGEIGFLGDVSGYAYLLRYSSSGDKRNQVYQNALQKLELGDGVTSIGNYAFSGCYSLASIAIPDSVTSIGNYAFSGCYSLASIAIPDGVTSIGESAFRDCYSLASITIPDGVTSIGKSAFNNCYSLASITIPDGVTSIGTHVFSNCYSLASIAIPDSVTSIGNYAFSGCYSLASIAIPDGVTSIGESAFQYCYGVRYYDFSNHTAVPTLSATSAFTSIPADCEIRVPAALYDEWIAATNWATYASYIVAV